MMRGALSKKVKIVKFVERNIYNFFRLSPPL